MSYFIKDALLATELRVVTESVTTWSRLEVLPTTSDLKPALQTAIADPLWMLHRQGAFGELQGEDAGSPIEVRLGGETAALVRFHPGAPAGGAAANAADYAHLALPLETVVEREAVTEQRRLVASAGRQFLRLLEVAGAENQARHFIAAYPLVVPAPAEPLADQQGAAWAAVLAGRALDALALRAATPRNGDGTVAGLPAAPAVPASREAAVRRALESWIAWFDSFVSVPTGDSSWQPSRQEYAFALSAQMSDGTVTLVASEYTDGRLDWHSFTAAAEPELGDPAVAVAPQPLKIAPMLPTPVRYPGMPADRLWEFEDAAVNLGGLDAGPTDLGRLLLVEYGLVYGNDWWVVPVDLPVGTLCKLSDFVVRDTFGVETPVAPSRNANGTPWEMFELSTVPGAPARLADLFFLPPSLAQRLEGDPIEEVRLVRDEMANLAWAVEHKVAGVSGEPVERRLESSRAAVHQQLSSDPKDATLVYRLQTPVPEHWIPFAPVSDALIGSARFDIQLERRALLRTMANGQRFAAHPRGLVLRTDLGQAVAVEAPLRLMEEEVPRDGAIVTRSMQYTRWTDGQSYIWVGRSKRTGRGEGSSGLRWDTSDRNA